MHTIQPCTMSCHFMQSHICGAHAFLAVTYQLHFWQNDQDLSLAAVVTQAGRDTEMRVGACLRVECGCLWGWGGGMSEYWVPMVGGWLVFLMAVGDYLLVGWVAGEHECQ